MALIKTDSGLPGIADLLASYPHAARALGELAEVLLRSREGLSPGERELVFATVSRSNGTTFCHAVHSEASLQQLQPLSDFDLEVATRQRKRRTALANLANYVALVTAAIDPREARAAGLSDFEIHDAVLIASAACMFNRYVSGLGADCVLPSPQAAAIAGDLIKHGYAQAVPRGQPLHEVPSTEG